MPLVEIAKRMGHASTRSASQLAEEASRAFFAGEHAIGQEYLSMSALAAKRAEAFGQIAGFAEEKLREAGITISPQVLASLVFDLTKQPQELTETLKVEPSQVLAGPEKRLTIKEKIDGLLPKGQRGGIPLSKLRKAVFPELDEEVANQRIRNTISQLKRDGKDIRNSTSKKKIREGVESRYFEKVPKK